MLQKVMECLEQDLYDNRGISLKDKICLGGHDNSWPRGCAHISGPSKVILEDTTQGEERTWHDNTEVLTGNKSDSTTKAAEKEKGGEGFLQIHLWCPNAKQCSEIKQNRNLFYRH